MLIYVIALILDKSLLWSISFHKLNMPSAISIPLNFIVALLEIKKSTKS